MKPHYDDIVKAAKTPPLWWDENGTPRFAEFEPTMCANVYAKQAMLMQVVCPRCRATCDVVVSCEQTDLDIQSDLAARDVGGLYGLLPHFGHCPYPYRPELIAVRSIWRRIDTMVWRRLYPREK
jgi:hypothetical protein